MYKSIISGVIVLSLVGCSPTLIRSNSENNARSIQTNPDLATISSKDVIKKNGQVTLPQNYDPSNYKKLAVAVSFYPSNSSNADKFSSVKSETLSSLFETEISKLKRFTILSRSQLGQQAIVEEIKFQDTGLVKSNQLMKVGQMKGAQYALSGGIAISSEKFERVANQELVIYVTVNYQLINLSTGEIEEADTAQGRSKRTFYQTPSGAWIGGFNVNDHNQATTAVNEAADGALKVIANKLGNKLPVGGKVVGIKDDLIQIDAGYDQGLMGKQIISLYTWDGVDVPLAYAEISPGKNKSNAKIIQWNNEKAAAPLVDRIKKDQMAFLRDFEVFAVSKGMPVPPEWDASYKN
jgi:curli biogenesis system outer membrane secretion channel CsgG